MTRRWLACLPLAALAAPPLVAQPARDCAYAAERNATLDATGAQRLEIEARAGVLRIEGRQDAAQIRVRGRACAENAAGLEAIRLIDSRNGATIRIEALLPEDGDPDWARSRLDLVIEVPLGIAATIRDTSGAIELRGLAGVTITDGSGAMSAADIDGSVHVTDGSGAITLHGINGDVEIADGSGQIEIRGVTGAVVLTDGSGEISVGDVTGHVTVRRDGSGSIRVVDVGGDLVIERDGSGGVSYRNIGGTVRTVER